MKNSAKRGSVLLCALLFSAATLASAQEIQKTIKKVPIANTSAVSGEEMFDTYCAVCHGKSGRGDGPAASEFKIPPTNLTHLAQKNNGKFPDGYVAQVVGIGPQNAKAHGSKDMPVWGSLFGKIGGASQMADSQEIKLRIRNLSKYIESLQAK